MATIEGRAAVPPGRDHRVPDGAGKAPQPGTVKPQLAAETLRLYAGDWARFARYCADHGQTACPAAPRVVATFLTASPCGRAALSRRLTAIDHQHRLRGYPPPGLDAGVRMALRQARRAAPSRKRAPAPLPVALQRMAQACRGDLAGRRDRTLLLLLAAGLGRAALVGLQAEQLRFTEPGVTLTPARAEAAPLHLARAEPVASCPVRALEDWLRASDTRYGPVFRKINRWGQLEHAALGVDAIRLILARRAAAPSGRRS